MCRFLYLPIKNNRSALIAGAASGEEAKGHAWSLPIPVKQVLNNKITKKTYCFSYIGSLYSFKAYNFSENYDLAPPHSTMLLQEPPLVNCEVKE